MVTVASGADTSGVIKAREKEAQKKFLAGASEKTARQEAGAEVRVQNVLTTGNELGAKSTTAEEARSKQASAEDLSASQAQERQQLESETLSIEHQADTATRLANAGLILPAKAANFIGKNLNKLLGIKEKIPFKEQTPEELAQTSLGKPIGAALGFLGSRSIGGVSVFSVFSGEGANIKNLQSDAGVLKSQSSIIMRDVAKGGDVNEAISTMGKIEDSVRIKYADAYLAMKSNPKGIAENLDLSEDMYRDLNTIMRRRQALERYQLTGDFNALLLASSEIDEFLPENQ